MTCQGPRLLQTVAGALTLYTMTSFSLTLEYLPAPTLPPDAPARLVEGQQVVLVHGFASTAQITWERTGWVRQFHRAGAGVTLVTLPCHRLVTNPVEDEAHQLTQVAVSFQEGEGLLSAISRSLAKALEAQAFGGQALEAQPGPVHLVGYSLGARLAWQVALSYPQLVATLTAGGLPTSTHLGGVHAYLTGTATSQALPPGLQAVLASSPLPRQALADFTAHPVEPFDLTNLPTCPVLLFAGDQDDLARQTPNLLADLPHPASTFLPLAGRDHITALTSGQARRATTDFIARHAISPAGREPGHTVA